MDAQGSAKETANAVNSLLHFCDADQEALVDVIEDYFCSNYQADFEGEDSDDDSNNEDAISGESMLKIMNIFVTIITFIIYDNNDISI